MELPGDLSITAVDVAAHETVASLAEGFGELTGLALWLMAERQKVPQPLQLSVRFPISTICALACHLAGVLIADACCTGHFYPYKVASIAFAGHGLRLGCMLQPLPLPPMWAPQQPQVLFHKLETCCTEAPSV